MELRDLNVLIGANGAGKSNFISVLALLGRIVDEELNLFVGQAGGASALLHRGSENGPEIYLSLEFATGKYHANLIPAARDELIFGTEDIELDGEGHVLGRGHRETRLLDELDEQGLSSVAGQVVDTLRGCRVFHFHDTSANAPVKQTGYASDNIALHPDARNLAAVLLRLQQEDRAAYRRIVRTIQQVAPFFRDFVLIEENGRLRLRWQQEGSDVVFPADALSDGTLRFICLTTLLSLPDLPSLVVLDEPELGLHPYAIVQLAEVAGHRPSRGDGNAPPAHPVRGPDRRDRGTRSHRALPARLRCLRHLVHPHDQTVLLGHEALGELTGDDALSHAVQAMVMHAQGAELVNDGVGTAPSKRLLRLYPRYRKTSDGPLVIAEIGIDTIRNACPHAAAWFSAMNTALKQEL
ncbi:Predicted ATPase [Nonomuraea solani]|uniref:Predicted ATPase n=1 Tax=Nonomuraea solani TaxID=1144553 RepID=A0A1H5YGR4_9ACTN|nr:Predicted ATPase [Nonomuraea solani]